MKVKLNISNVIRKESKNENLRKGDIREYKVNTSGRAAKLTTVEDNIIKLEFNDKRKRNGYVRRKDKARKYFLNFFKNENNIPKNYYRLFIAMLILAIISAGLVIKNYKFTDLEDFLTYNLNTDGVIQASSSIDTTDLAKEAELKEVSIQSTVSNKKEVTTSSNENVVVEKLVFGKPINGEISKIFSDDKVIYSKTLELWKTHDGIDIEGEIGQNVVSIEKGKVDKVYEDSFFGYTVVIDHGQGYKSIYSNLSENIPVKQGQVITKGKVIGQISNTSIGEIKDDPHLHFTLMKDNQVIDPTYIMKN